MMKAYLDRPDNTKGGKLHQTVWEIVVKKLGPDPETVPYELYVSTMMAVKDQGDWMNLIPSSEREIAEKAKQTWHSQPGKLSAPGFQDGDPKVLRAMEVGAKYFFLHP